MTSNASEVSGIGRSLEGISSGQLSRSGEAIAEWRSSDQVENGTPSTSPPYWDTDDDDDCGPKPSELYGKYTWKIGKFSEINKRELRSDPFEVGGYEWYILIYPQGCDVCNHLSLFLCVANHDKLLPGWSHFAQFTIAVVNKVPKNSKYSDTLHRFWKKEHDWGWKKFMELSKISDGFIDADTLIIKAQVQVIRERADRPFRCLDCQYRRELVRVYLANVEQICRCFVEERRGKVEKLIEDKARWSSFRDFWLGVDQNARRRMSREKTDAISKVVLKHFFLDKEVTSTLVMDSLYSGLKALEGKTKSRKGGANSLDAEERPVPIVCVEKDMFVLVDDVLLLLERAAMEPMPPKDEKGPQNRTKDGSSTEDFSKESIERVERRLMELGRRTIEIFILAHIFSKIEVAYHEAVALKRQEELIREEEAAWMAESEQKAKRGVEKKSKKKQGKQKRNTRKGKDKGKDDKSGVAVQNKHGQEDLSDETKDSLTEQTETLLENPDKMEDVSDLSDSVDRVLDIIQPDSEERDASPVSCDMETSEVQPPIEASSNGISVHSSVQNGMGETQRLSATDDSSSTCSTESVPSVVTNGLYNRNSIRNRKSQKSPSRSERLKMTCDSTSRAAETHNQPPELLKEVGQLDDVSGSCKAAESECIVLSLQGRLKWLERHVAKKEEEVSSLKRELSIKDRADTERSSTNGKTVAMPISPRSPPKKLPSGVQLRSESKINPPTNLVLVGQQSSSVCPQTDKAAILINSAENAVSSKPDTREARTSKATEKLMAQQIPVISKPLNARLIPAARPTAPVVPVVQTTPSLTHAISAAGRLGPELSAATRSYVPQSYRGAIMSNPVAASSVASSAASLSQSYSEPPTLISTPMFLPQSSDRMNLDTIRPGFSFGLASHEASRNGFQWVECHIPDTSRSSHSDFSSSRNDVQNYDLYKPVQNLALNHFPTDFPAFSSARQSQGAVADEFPHLDIINDLLDDEHAIGNFDSSISGFRSFSNGPHHLNRQSTFPSDFGFSSDMPPSTRSCRFERTRSYPDDGLQQGYGSSNGYFDSMRDMIPIPQQPTQQPYVNGLAGELVPNQWQMAASNLSSLSLRHNEGDSSAYHIPEYSNLACAVNGYTVFQPPNGH